VPQSLRFEPWRGEPQVLSVGRVVKPTNIPTFPVIQGEAVANPVSVDWAFLSKKFSR
jgi:hypothetical protein